MKQLIRRVIAFLLIAGSPVANAAAQIVRLDQAPAQDAAQGGALPTQERTPQRVGVDESNPLMLTLFDAVKLALQNNREIEVERINVQQANYDLFSARGARDVTLGASSFFEHRVLPAGSVLAGGPNGTITTKGANWDFGAQQLMPSGAQWTAQFTNLRSDTNSVFNSLNPQYSSVLNFQIRQPLLRNFSMDDARRRIRVANRRLDLSDSQFRQKAIEIVSRVQRSYWDLVFGLREVQIQREAVDLARAQRERNSRMVDQGTLAPIELVSVDVELERRRENVLTALEVVTRAENALKQLILGDRGSAEWNKPIIPTETPDLTVISMKLDEALAAAFANRPELAQNNAQQEINKIDTRYFSNQAKPAVDLIASYATTGLAGTPVTTAGSPFTATTDLLVARVNTLSELASLPPLTVAPPASVPGFLVGGYGQSLSSVFSNDFRTFRFGVSFSFPIRNRSAEGQLGRSLAEGRKIGTQRQILEQSIEAEVRNALQSVEMGRERVETARASREAAEKQYQSEQRRFDSGLSTTYFVLERQNTLSESRGRELRALTEYNKALAELQRVMGTTLTSANVEVSPPESKR
ncbi:MAG TPA: TolC family protein [Blastocatellia bacterium]|nr:TolC family protein [Blastocatellia bacterium]